MQITKPIATETIRFALELSNRPGGNLSASVTRSRASWLETWIGLLSPYENRCCQIHDFSRGVVSSGAK